MEEVTVKKFIETFRTNIDFVEKHYAAREQDTFNSAVRVAMIEVSNSLTKTLSDLNLG